MNLKIILLLVSLFFICASGIDKKNSLKEQIKSSNKDICPNCNEKTTKIEGCATCFKCGISFC